jgi:hypothetical protein
MSLSSALSFLNRPWRTPLGKLVSFGIAAFVLYGTYTQVMEQVDAIEANGGEVLFDDSVEESEAQALANYLVKEEYFAGRPSSVRLTKDEGIYHVQFVILKEHHNDSTLDVAFSHLAAGISEQVFSDASTVAHVSDDEWNNIREIPEIDLGERLVTEKVKLYYQEGVTKEHAEAALAEFEKLVEDDPDASQLMLQLRQVDGTYYVSFAADVEKVAGDAGMRASGLFLAKSLSAEVFGGSPVVFQFTDIFFESFLSISSTEVLPIPEEEVVPAN